MDGRGGKITRSPQKLTLSSRPAAERRLPAYSIRLAPQTEPITTARGRERKQLFSLRRSLHLWLQQVSRSSPQ